MAKGTRSIQLKRSGLEPSIMYSVKAFAIFDTSALKPPIWSKYAAAVMGLLANIAYHAGKRITVACQIGFVICFQKLVSRFKGEFGIAGDKDKDKEHQSSAASSSSAPPTTSDIRLSLADADAQRLEVQESTLTLGDYIHSLNIS